MDIVTVRVVPNPPCYLKNLSKPARRHIKRRTGATKNDLLVQVAFTGRVSGVAHYVPASWLAGMEEGDLRCLPFKGMEAGLYVKAEQGDTYWWLSEFSQALEYVLK